MPSYRLAMRSLSVRSLLFVFLAGVSCTTANRIYDHEGKEALLIECGASVSFSVCHDRAKKECPSGYTTISEDSGFNRKEIRVRCHPPR
jgi:hypothetical protein